MIVTASSAGAAFVYAGCILLVATLAGLAFHWSRKRHQRAREQILVALRSGVEMSGAMLSARTVTSSAYLYPALQELESEGWIVGEFEEFPRSGAPRRRLYQLAANVAVTGGRPLPYKRAAS